MESVEMEGLHDEIPKVASMVVTMMREWDSDLDYSMESLDLIDDQIEKYRKEGLTAASMSATMTAFGIYVGEVIRRTLGHGHWARDAESDVYLAVESFAIDPIGKCMKRLDNGPEDCVKAFSEFVVRCIRSVGERDGNKAPTDDLAISPTPGTTT